MQSHFYNAAFSIATALAVVFSCAAFAEQPAADGVAVPEDVRFTTQDIQAGRTYTIAGRFTINRTFLGTRSDPQFVDQAEFHSFDGTGLKRLVFSDRQLEQQLIGQLKCGRSVPAVATIKTVEQTIGHDGINMSRVVISTVVAYTAMPADRICDAAKAHGHDKTACDSFANSLEPDHERDGIVVSMGEVSVRPKALPHWKEARVFVRGVRVFNTTSKPAAIKIVGARVEQDTEAGVCTLMDGPGSGPASWTVAAESWSGGHYEQGKMPATLWQFTPGVSIVPDEPVTVQVQLSINGGDPVTVTRKVNPMSTDQGSRDHR